MSLFDVVARTVPDQVRSVERSVSALLEPVEGRPSIADALRTSARVTALLVFLGAAAWGTGQPFLFPSLGPSAYALAVSPSAATSQPQRVFGGHLFGVAAGLVVYHLLAPGLSVTQLPPAFSENGLRLAGSAVASLGLTSAAMLLSDLRHAPACATTLIVALGLLTTLGEAGIILAAVLALTVLDWLLPRFGGVENPPR